MVLTINEVVKMSLSFDEFEYPDLEDLDSFEYTVLRFSLQ